MAPSTIPIPVDIYWLASTLLSSTLYIKGSHTWSHTWPHIYMGSHIWSRTWSHTWSHTWLHIYIYGVTLGHTNFLAPPYLSYSRPYHWILLDTRGEHHSCPHLTSLHTPGHTWSHTLGTWSHFWHDVVVIITRSVTPPATLPTTVKPHCQEVTQP